MPGYKPQPLVSVLLPVYNAAPYLAESVQSILDQTFDDFELIAVDDGSVDGSGEILERLARADGRLRVFLLPHRGQSSTRNFTICQARGEFLAEQDSDDLSLPRRLELQVGYLRDHPDCVVVGGRGEQMDPDGDRIGEIPVRRVHDEIEEELLRGRGSAIIHSAAAYRRDAVLAVGGYHEGLELSEDLDLFLKLAERGRLANLPDLVVRQRRHPRSVSATSREEYARSAVNRVLQDTYRRRGWREDEIVVQSYYSPRTEAEMYLVWTAQALQAGHLRTAAKYGRRLLRPSLIDPYPWCRFLWRGLVGSGLRAVRRRLCRSFGRDRPARSPLGAGHPR
jgi:hypothetical protein